MKTKFKIYDYIICALFSALTAIGAFIKIPMPPPFVDFTLQFLFAVMAGLILGSKRGAFSQVVYIVIGLLGIPVFTKGGGPQYIFQPTFGYLLGFILCAYTAGKILENKQLTFKNAFLSCVAGLLVVYVIGVAYMYMIYNLYLNSETSIWILIFGGAIICAPGDIFLCIVASILSLKIIPILNKQNLVKRKYL